MKIATESGRWYKLNGEPCHTVIGKNGKERNTTIADAKKLNLVPSVTTILNLMPKYALNKWIQRQTLLSALTLPIIEGEAEDSYIDRIIHDADEQSKKAREKGTAIHGAIEKSLTGQEYDSEYIPYVTGAMESLREYLGYQDLEVIPEKSFAHILGYGGKVDLHSRSLNFVCDFKTKEFDEATEKLQWPEHEIQLEAYARGLDLPADTKKINVYISTKKGKEGLVRVCESKDNSEKNWKVFMACLQLFKALKSL